MSSLAALLFTHSLTALLAALAAHPLVLLAALAPHLSVLLLTHSLATLLLALLGLPALTLLTAPTLLVAHLLGPLSALWLGLLALVASLAAVLEVRLSDRIGLEPALVAALLASTAPVLVPRRLSTSSLLAARLATLLAALRSLAAAGLLAATSLTVSAGRLSAVVRFAGGSADVFLRTVPLLRAASRSFLGAPSRRAVRARFLAAAAAVESV